jgi:uncharacterized protein YidB (DUF937 family)
VQAETRVKKDDVMSRGYPSMTALLALIAMAGYQNRDKIAEWIKQAQAKTGSPAPGSATAGAGGPPGQLGGVLAGSSITDIFGNGLRDLVDAFKQAGHGDKADSWVGPGPNKQIGAPDLEKAIGTDVLARLSEHTGLSREEILARLSKALPDAVDKYTPAGRIPTPAELA